MASKAKKKLNLPKHPDQITSDAPRTRRPRRTTPLRGRVHAFVLTQDGPVSVSAVAKALKEPTKDVGSSLASLVRSGALVRVSRGQYAVKDGLYPNTVTPTVDDVVKAREASYFQGDSPVVTANASPATSFEGDHVVVETYADDSDNFIDWLSQHLGVSPDRVAVAIAYYEMFVSESADSTN